MIGVPNTVKDKKFTTFFCHFTIELDNAIIMIEYNFYGFYGKFYLIVG